MCASSLGQHIEEVGGQEAGAGGWGGRWQQLLKNTAEKLHSEDMNTRAVHLVSHEAQ